MLSDFESLFEDLGSSLRNVSSWIERLPELSDVLRDTRRGRPRLLSYRDAMLLVVMAGVVGAGAEPKVAVVTAKKLSKKILQRENFQQWAIFARSEFGTVITEYDTDVETLSRLRGRAQTYAFVPLAEIRKEVAAMYDIL